MHLQAQLQTLELSRLPTGHRYPDMCPKSQTLPSVTSTWNDRAQGNLEAGRPQSLRGWKCATL